jgi:hypothetical protein
MARYKAIKDPDALPEGTYAAHFLDYEERQGNYGPYLIWTFKVYCDDETQDVTGITNTRFGTRSKEYRFIEALQGRAPQDGEDIDLNVLRGAVCQVELDVRERKNGNGASYTVNNVVNVQPAKPLSKPLDLPGDDDVPF